jgi:ADP-heptose:LPS heptosyltransferase
MNTIRTGGLQGPTYHAGNAAVANIIKDASVSKFKSIYPWTRFFAARRGRELIASGDLEVSVTAYNRGPKSIADPRNIVFIPSKGLGDVLIQTPAAVMLKRLLPESKITMVVRNAWQGLLEGVPGIDAIKYADGSTDLARGLMTAVNDLRKQERPDVFIWSWCWNSFGELVRSADDCVTISGAHRYKNFSKDVDYSVYTRKGGSLSGPVYAGIQWGLSLLLPIFGNTGYMPEISGRNNILQPEISPTIITEQKVSGLFKRLEASGNIDLGRPLIFINILASDLSRSISANGTKDLINRLLNSFQDAAIILSRGTGHRLRDHHEKLTENQYIESVFREFRFGTRVSLLPQLSIPDLTAFLSVCRLAITTDTGLSHLLASRQLSHVPSIVLFPNLDKLNEWGLPRDNRYYFSNSSRTYLLSKCEHLAMDIDDRFFEFVLQNAGRHLRPSLSSRQSGQ